jgi:iron complex transport system substrate-binding protein
MPLIIHKSTSVNLCVRKIYSEINFDFPQLSTFSINMPLIIHKSTSVNLCVRNICNVINIGFSHISKFIFKWIFILLIFTLNSCSSPKETNTTPQYVNSFAKGFEIQKFNGFQQVIVKNPWQKAQGESFSYILTPRPASVPDSLQTKTIIKTPVKRVIVFSSTHVGNIAALGKSSGIVGVSGKDFISDSTVRFSLEKQKCYDIGFAPNIDFERILELKPDLVFLYGLDPSVTGLVKRLEDVGIRSVLVSEFLEDHPLGKAEWLLFFSAFFESERAGDSIFTVVKQNYLALRDSIANIKTNPFVLVGLPWKDTWYMAGGKSFTAKLIEDAGGKYLWEENLNTDFIPLDLESVFQKAINADVWINTGSAGNRAEILSADPRFRHVKAFQNGNLFNNNARVNSTGGNDFWESGTVRPDWILKDLIRIFHTDDSVKHDLFYYKKLE